MNNTVATKNLPLVEAHHALMEKIDRLLTEARSEKPLGPALAAVRAQVVEHFRMEEAGGYMSDVLRQKPELERVVAKLLHEHRTLTKSLDTILESLPAAADSDALRRRIDDWAIMMREHEKEENLLVEDAYGQDVGAKD